MQDIDYRNGELYVEEVPLTDIAQAFGSPAYVYSRATIERNYLAYAAALRGSADSLEKQTGLVCYAVKANSNIAILQVLAQLGAGFDIVSIGELERVLRAGGDPAKVVFSGVGKTSGEVARALEAGVYCFNVESEAELEMLAEVASDMGKIANVSLRVNPDVDANTHPYISTGLKENKFGINIESAKAVYQRAAQLSSLSITGVDCHIGSQLTETAPFLDALDRLLQLIDELAAEGIELQHLDVGGGLGVSYRDEQPPSIESFIQQIKEKLGQRTLALIVEPGRSIVANAGVLLTQVIHLKQTDHKNFAIIDAAMNDNIRPALYQAWLNVLPVIPRKGDEMTWDLVGPVCETSDFLAKERLLTLDTEDYLAVMSSGAYSFAMSSNYNTRPRAAEIMIDGKQVHLIRERESINDLLRGETLLPDE